MSHLVSIKTQLLNLQAVQAACKELGLTYKENQTTYKWWGQSVGDYPLPKGFTAADLGRCDHAIGIPGTKWEVGVVKLKDSPGYTLLFDFFGSQGRPILEALGGKEASKFVQLYGVCAAELEAMEMGCTVTRTRLSNGNIELELTGGSL